MVSLSGRNLLGIQELTAEEIELILDTAEGMKDVATRKIKKVPTLRGNTIVNIFYEPSTRTRSSFNLAGKYLSANVLNLSVSKSSVTKGESLYDTARTIEAMNADLVVIRHGASGSSHFLARHIRAQVVNAGDGMHEHPTQALLDLFTIREHMETIAGKRVAIIGDISHSRVARSNIWALKKMGAEVTLVGPRTLLPREVDRLGVEVTTELEPVLAESDILYLLRLQLERQKEALFPSLREYARFYGINGSMLSCLKPECLIMHPGPMNRGVEIADEVAEAERAVINEQVTSGVAVRMAIFYLLLGRESSDEDLD